MKKLAFALVCIFMSCSEDDSTTTIVTEVPQANTITLQVNGTEVTDDIREINAFYMCDEFISVTVTSQSGLVTSDLFTMKLYADGDLVRASFYEKEVEQSDVFYSTANYIPKENFTINEFEFSPNENLHISFSGDVYKETHNYYDTPETITISGDINISEFGNTLCNVFNDELYLNNDIVFYDVVRTYINNSNYPSNSYSANNNNGYYIALENLENSLKELPLGTYALDNTTGYHLDFKEYIGLPNNFTSSFHWPDDWKVYDTQGSFTIVEKTTIDGFEVVKVNLNFTASYEGEIVYEFTNAYLETAY